MKEGEEKDGAILRKQISQPVLLRCDREGDE